MHRLSKIADVQLFSVMRLPPWVKLHIGGYVAVRSVKFLGRLHTRGFDMETRDRWWAELREELRAHAASLSCTQVMGYRETAVICNDVCLLSVYGTAVNLRNALPGRPALDSRMKAPTRAVSQRSLVASLRSQLNYALLQRPWYLPLSAIAWLEAQVW